MPIPSHEDAMLPVLKELLHVGQMSSRDLVDRMADIFELSAEERALMTGSGKATVIRSRVGWALTYLKQAGLVESPRRGWYQISQAGRAVLESQPTRIDNKFLAQFESFRSFTERSPRADRKAPELTSSTEVPPDEELERAYEQLRFSVESELLEAIRRVSPAFFEQLVVDLLVAMGYGGSHEEAARTIGRSGDGGIDGVIDEDRLGLDSIYVQAKRWEGSVGRPEIQKFAGALQGQRASKGIFITSSSFTAEAIDYVQKIGTRIVLVDGRRLAALMFEYNVGVAARRNYIVKSVDSDYFEE